MYLNSSAVSSSATPCGVFLISGELASVGFVMSCITYNLKVSKGLARGRERFPTSPFSAPEPLTIPEQSGSAVARCNTLSQEDSPRADRSMADPAQSFQAAESRSMENDLQRSWQLDCGIPSPHVAEFVRILPSSDSFAFHAPGRTPDFLRILRRGHDMNEIQFSYLKRLEPEHYRAQACVHWSMTILDRRTGWLVPFFYYKFRELLTHSMFR